MSRSDIIAVVYNKILGKLEGMHDWFTKHRIKLPQSIQWLTHVAPIYTFIQTFFPLINADWWKPQPTQMVVLVN